MGIKSKALNELRAAWQSKIRGMQQIEQATTVKPNSPQQVIRADSSVKGQTAKLNCGPVVFRLSERAGAMPEMFVVVEGSIEVQATTGNKYELKTRSFTTRVGYFRRKGGRLDHIYGVHYDMDEERDGHPIFPAIPIS